MAIGLLNEAERIYGGPAPEYFPGQTVAGVNPMQQAGIQGSIDAGNQMAGYIPGMMDAAGGSLNALGQFAQGGGAQVGSQYTDMLSAAELNNIQGNFEVNPFINDQVDAFGQAAQRTLEQNILPSTVSDALGAGQMGSSRHGIAQGVATSNLGQSLQEQLAGLHATAWQNAANNQLTSRGQTLNALGQERGRGTTAAIANANNETAAYGMLPSAMNAYGNMANTAAGIGQLAPAAQMAGGAIYQQNAQDMLNAEQERWDFYQNQPWDQLSQYASIVGGSPNMGQGAVPSYVNPMASGMLGAGTGIQTAGMLGGSPALMAPMGGGAALGSPVAPGGGMLG